ncbi:MAG: RHS repeat-associated core domain-containing protein, partial [Cytophaga sp.]|uniref:RHS repeat-associated core domain-containing protein n=1 Tax=Cytophaga sp. TaxID=29535 RepID=UPI003F806C1E
MTSEGDTARHLEYDCADRLRAFFVQTGTAEPSKYTHYLYDGSGNRVKKLTRRQGGKYTATTYIDGAFEYTKESTGYDGIPNLTIGTWIIGQYSSGGEQNIIHIMGGATKCIGADLGDSTPAVKYNLSDHLGSSCVQLDTNGTTVSLEEYYPFGETSFGSYAKKRYRFCGKEKDEESGLYYYGMRYYSPWTCRFISVDPLAGKYAYQSPYPYASNKPINNTDIDGAETPGQPQSPSGGASGSGQPTSRAGAVTGTSGSSAAGSTSGQIYVMPPPPAGMFNDVLQKMKQNTSSTTQNTKTSDISKYSETTNNLGNVKPHFNTLEEAGNSLSDQLYIYEPEYNAAAKIEKGIEIVNDLPTPEAKIAGIVLSSTYSSLDAIFLYSTKISGDVGITSEGLTHMNGAPAVGTEVQDAGISSLLIVGTWGMMSTESAVANRIAAAIEAEAAAAATESTVTTGLTNAEVRVWYNEQLESLNTSVAFTEENAMALNAQRNALKIEARAMMADREAAALLEKTDPIRPFE